MLPWLRLEISNMFWPTETMLSNKILLDLQFPFALESLHLNKLVSNNINAAEAKRGSPRHILREIAQQPVSDSMGAWAKREFEVFVRRVRFLLAGLLCPIDEEILMPLHLTIYRETDICPTCCMGRCRKARTHH